MNIRQKTLLLAVFGQFLPLMAPAITTVSTDYGYDGLGNRTRRVINGTVYMDVLDRGAALHNVLMVTTTNGTPVRYFIWGRGIVAQRSPALTDSIQYPIRGCISHAQLFTS